MKTCSKCNVEKLETEEFFYKKGKGRNGLRAICKDCETLSNKQYRENNKDKISKTKRIYNEINKESISIRKQKYYKDNKQKISKKSKIYYSENKEDITKKVKHYRLNNLDKIKSSKRKKYLNDRDIVSEQNSIYYKDNKETIKEYVRKYNKNNPEIKRLSEQKRKAIKRKLPHSLTVNQWNSIKQYFNNECAYCGMSEFNHISLYKEQLHQEHFIALSKGGGYTHHNIIPSCKTCNCSKHNKDFFEWYPSYELYNKEREVFILDYLGNLNEYQQLSIL